MGQDFTSSADHTPEVRDRPMERAPGAWPKGAPVPIVPADGAWIDYRTVAEAAEMIGVDPSVVRRQIKAGKIEAIRRGRDWFIPRVEAERYRDSERRPGRPRSAGQQVVLKRRVSAN